MPHMDTISVALKEHGANGLKTRSGSREGRTHSQAAQTGATFETQKIRRDSLVLETNVVEAAGRTDDSVTEMALCLLLVFCICFLGELQDRAFALRSANGRNIIFANYYCRFHYVRISVLSKQFTVNLQQSTSRTAHPTYTKPDWPD
jgi:hypothetical protein